ncbi:MAG: hypothetical protein AAF449_09435 [Myxococcota bacterium]
MLQRAEYRSAGSKGELNAEAVFANGRQAVRDVLVSRYRLRVSDADDIAQEVSLRLWREVNNGRRVLADLVIAAGRPSGLWFYVARLSVADFHNKRRRREPILNASTTDHHVAVDHAPTAARVAEGRQTLQRLLRSEDVMYAAGGELGVSDEELGRRHGLTVTTVRKRRQRFRAAHRHLAPTRK